MTGRRRISTTSGGRVGPTQTARLLVGQKSPKKLATRWRGGQTQTAQDSLRPERVWERRQVHVHHPDGQRLRSGCMPTAGRARTAAGPPADHRLQIGSLRLWSRSSQGRVGLAWERLPVKWCPCTPLQSNAPSPTADLRNEGPAVL